MRKNKASIKARITFWYICVFSFILAFVFLNIYLLSNQYSIHDLEMELRDETGDMVEELKDQDDLLPFLEKSDWTQFYDDNVMISLYQKDGIFINGVIPDHFPEGIEFSDNESRKIEVDSDTWLVHDYLFEEEGNSPIWIRSIASYSYWVKLLHGMLKLFAIIFPLAIFIAGFIGYGILKRALYPIYTISDTAKDISSSLQLSKRIETSSIKDEFAYLTAAFNEMITRLEESFESEKQFTSDAAHELRTPIAVIQGHCEYCLEDVDLSDEARDEITIIYDKTKKISTLVTQLLSIARAERYGFQPEIEKFDLGFMTESIREELEEKAKLRNISIYLKNDLKNEDNNIQGDMMLLMRIMYNLIENAINYGKENGHVWIHLQKEKQQCLISVKDDGIGMNEEELDKIWNRFYRVDRSRTGDHGFGLGLYMVKYIVEIHHGKVEVVSDPGIGSTFTIYLPYEQ
ncbi:MAG: HAMP domain-containing sensor histidine kinase [Eubacteriales bacterium]|nr:HAMP domain-containing sensor histidine kinase [Eubacteriales bacterium]